MGVWWLPSDESEERSGTLTVANGAAALELIGDFGHKLLSETARPKTYSLEPADQPRIVGLSSGGKPITLEGTRSGKHTQSFPGLATTIYNANVTLVGKQFADGEDIGFDEISISASDLNEWSRVSGFRSEIGMEKHEDADQFGFSNLAVRFNAPDNIDIALAGGERAFVRFSVRTKGLRTNHVALDQEAALHVRFSKRAGLEEVFERVSQVRNFLSLAVGRPVAIFSVTGYQDDYVRDTSGAPLPDLMRDASRRPLPIELLWEIPHNPNAPTRSLQPSEMLFTLPEATPDISMVMRRWFARQARLKPVFNLFFGTRYHPATYLEVKFLAYAQAVETYDYRRRQKPGDLYLSQRIRDVLNECKAASKRIVGTRQADQDAFIETFKISRNYYTHYTPKLESKAAHGVGLRLLCVQLEAIIEMSLLRELGFGCRSIDAILERGQRFAQIKHFKAVVAARTGEDA